MTEERVFRDAEGKLFGVYKDGVGYRAYRLYRSRDEEDSGSFYYERCSAEMEAKDMARGRCGSVMPRSCADISNPYKVIICEGVKGHSGSCYYKHVATDALNVRSTIIYEWELND
jgi:hypothetical protein